MKLIVKNKVSKLSGLLLCLFGLQAAPILAAAGSDKEATMTVYKSPTCGCCTKWANHIEQNGFQIRTVEVNDLSSIKAQFGIQPHARSCHTGIVSRIEGDYVFEGHVPAQYVEQFLNDPPEGAFGLSVPGMPAGSPGMEVGERKDYYQVLLLNKDGSSSIYAHVNQKN